MPNYTTTARYSQGHAGFVLFALDTMPAPTDDSLGAAPTLAKLGLTNVPGYEMRENARAIRGAGKRSPAAIRKNRRDISLPGRVTLCSGAATLLFMQCVLAKANAAIPAANRSACQPVVTVASGAFEQCAPTSVVADIARAAMLSSLTLTGQVNQEWMLDYTLQAVAMPTLISTGAVDLSESAINAAAGEPFVWNDCFFTGLDANGDDVLFDDRIQSFSLGINANVRPTDVYRHRIIDEASPDGEGVLSRTARALRPGLLEMTYNFGLTDPLPKPIVGLNLNFVGVNEDNTRSVALTGLVSDTYGRGAADPDSPFGYTESGLLMDVDFA